MPKNYEFEQIELGHWGHDDLMAQCHEAWEYHFYELNELSCLLWIQMYEEDKGSLYLLPKTRVIEALGSE